jgi:hypothetical protein
MDKRLTSLFTFKEKPIIIGTASSGVKNYSDIDINVNVSLDDKDEIYKRLEMLDEDYFITEIKIQNKDVKYKMKDLFEFYDKYETLINKNTDYLKVDFKGIRDNEIIPYEILMFFKPKTSKSLTTDIKELAKKGNYWKALKRLFSKARHNKDEGKIKLFKDFIDGDVGIIGKYLSLIDTLDELSEVVEIENLKEFKNELNNKIKSIIEKDNLMVQFDDIRKIKAVSTNPSSWLNYKAKEFLNKYNLF